MAVVTINDKEHDEENFTDKQKYLLAQVRDIDNKIGSLRFQLDQLAVARDSFGGALIKEVEVEDVQEGTEV
jgi:hypothetical protein